VDAAAEDVRQAAAILRRAVAEGSLPASAEGLVTQLEQVAARARTHVGPPDDDGAAKAAES